MLRIERVSWAEAEPQLSLIRRRVFIEEQQVPEELEWDGDDDDAVQLMASYENIPVGTVRMLTDGHVGRMAVLKEYRHLGIGQQLMQDMIALARQQGLQRLLLSAQTHAVSFYQQFGFIADDAIFIDAGIPHRQMQLQLLPE